MGAWCERCERNFPHQRALEQHLLNAYVHNYCPVCERDFSSRFALAQHRQNSSSHHICGQCGEDFRFASYLDDHIEECHWYCSRCEIFVDSGSMLQSHYRESYAHHYCGPCEREFIGASQLNAHLRSKLHAGENFQCMGCLRRFVSLSAMTIHLESGTCTSGATRQKVNDMVRSYDRNNLITNRLLEYPDAKRRVDTWATSAAWNGHAYECYFCPREFRTLQALNQHLKSPVHEHKMYKCPKCTTKFKLLSGLIQHVESEACGVHKFRDVKMAMDGLTSNLGRMVTY